jgi:hypothetical protein
MLKPGHFAESLIETIQNRGEERTSLLPAAKVAADERHWVAPVGVTQPAQCANLKCAGRAWCQIRNRDFLRTWQRKSCP